MKKIIGLFILGFIAFTSQAQTKEVTEQKTDPNAPVFKFETELIDYGTIKKNANGTRVFKFKNTGKSPLTITKVKSSCGCTVPKKPEKPIMPGETGEIEVKYATNRVGRFSKNIFVTSNAAGGTKLLRIKGEVLKPNTTPVVQ